MQLSILKRDGDGGTGCGDSSDHRIESIRKWKGREGILFMPDVAIVPVCSAGPPPETEKWRCVFGAAT
ncbi:hypothetical protein [Pirellula sp. SH-Sr6A]|uniref:hypothetical protein n=1 Tax=Pirellula sp. SH-Sr6A TaxID=1632865 RepID=UPI0011BAB275|nr:hypothetical protein [Pirellula sp. SH-Sr6A]